MSNKNVTTFLFAAIVESLLIIGGNIFTIFVFWKHRNRLRRTCLLLVNLAVADLLVGFTEPIALGAFDIPRHFQERISNIINGNISTPFQVAFSFASVFFLVLISLERAYALIWPRHHRLASTRGYIYTVTFGWIAGMSVGILTLLAVYDILDFEHWTYALGCIIVLCLIAICVSYIAIRTRLKRRVPAIDAVHHRHDASQEKTKFSRTLFVVITASLVFLFPSILVYHIHHVCSACVPRILFQVFNILRSAGSLVNPIIYSFRIPMFKETFKQMKLCKKSKQYTVSYIP